MLAQTPPHPRALSPRQISDSVLEAERDAVRHFGSARRQMTMYSAEREAVEDSLRPRLSPRPFMDAAHAAERETIERFAHTRRKRAAKRAGHTAPPRAGAMAKATATALEALREASPRQRSLDEIDAQLDAQLTSPRAARPKPSAAAPAWRWEPEPLDWLSLARRSYAGPLLSQRWEGGRTEDGKWREWEAPLWRSTPDRAGAALEAALDPPAWRSEFAMPLSRNDGPNAGSGQALWRAEQGRLSSPRAFIPTSTTAAARFPISEGTPRR